MLSETNLSVFDAVRTFLEGGDYVVIDKEELKALLPETLTMAEINTALVSLQTNELIRIRYSDVNVYCLALLPKGVLMSEKRKEEQKKARAIAEQIAEQRDLQKEMIANKAKEEKEQEVEEKPVLNIVSTKRVALISGLCSFFGSLVAGLVILAVLLAKLG